MNGWPVAVVTETVETLQPAMSLVTLGTEVYTYLFGQPPTTSISMTNTLASAHILTNRSTFVETVKRLRAMLEPKIVYN